MNETEKRSLIDKILKASQDPKAARVAVSVFNNQAREEDARFFLQYLDSEDLNQRKMAHSIVAHFGLKEAVAILNGEIGKLTGNLTFLPDAAYKEEHFFATLIEIFETVFAVLKKNEIRDDGVLRVALDIFKKTTHQDLRFSLIKIIAHQGDNYQYLFSLYDKFSEKEKRALYHSYSFIEAPGRVELYRKGLRDERNFEFAVANMLQFPEGKALLQEYLPVTNSENRLKVLRQMEEQDLSGMEEILVVMLSDENRYVSDLAAALIIKNSALDFKLDKFIAILENSFISDQVKNCIEILDHFIPSETTPIFLAAFKKQPLAKNKSLILDILLKHLKEQQAIEVNISQELLQSVMPLLENYHVDREELVISIAKILPHLVYLNSTQLKGVKKSVLELEKELLKQQEIKVRNNIVELLNRLNAVITQLEEGEAQIRSVLNLFDIPQEKISAERLMKLREELQHAGYFEKETSERLIDFFKNCYLHPSSDWKKRSCALELIGMFATASEFEFLREVASREQALGVKVTADKIVGELRQKLNIQPPLIALFESSFYLKKIIKDFLKDRDVTIVEVADYEQLQGLLSGPMQLLFVGEALLQPALVDFFRKCPEKRMILITDSPERHPDLQQVTNITLLKKPFRPEDLAKATGYE